MLEFTSIAQFKNIKRTCLFCQNKLFFCIENISFLPNKNLNSIRSTNTQSSEIHNLTTDLTVEDSGYWDYHTIQTTSCRLRLSYDVNLNNNQVLANINNLSNNEINFDRNTLALNHFNDLSLVSSLYCNHCDNGYCFTSKALVIVAEHYYDHYSYYYKLLPFGFGMFSFVLDEDWIQNFDDKTCISPIYSSTPLIEIPQVNWANLTIDEIRDKIKTIKTFY